MSGDDTRELLLGDESAGAGRPHHAPRWSTSSSSHHKPAHHPLSDVSDHHSDALAWTSTTCETTGTEWSLPKTAPSTVVGGHAASTASTATSRRPDNAAAAALDVGGLPEEEDADGDDETAESLSRHQHRLASWNLANNGNRWGWRFDPDQPIYRVWTNVRGSKVHYAMAMWTALLLIAILACRVPPPPGKAGLNDIFTMHLVMMLLCWWFMSEGLMIYRAGEIGTGASVETLRSRHRGLMTFSGIFLLCGLVAILAHKNEHGKSMVPSSLHAWCGWLAAVGTAAQAWIGAAKYVRFQRNQGKSYTWHGNAGQGLYSLVVVTLVLGFLRLHSVTLLGVWVFFISIALGVITVMAAMYQPTSFGGDQHDQVKPTREVGEHDVELLNIQ
eukprot:m.194916 g.194916  ORF g.194916 m.194916 type:complete len:387 (+) comp19339_c0_seq1:442-1602(+)